MTRSGLALVAMIVVGWASAPAPAQAAPRTVRVSLSGGFEVRSNDYGRPVPLYASMLGVTPDVFRQAFSGVNPDAEHDPSGEEQRANKEALLEVLAPYGVTNEELDRVANYYRFDSTKGETWPQRPARARARVVRGKVVSIRVIDPGVGYTYRPDVSVPGFPKLRVSAKLAFTDEFDTNGHIRRIRVRKP
jgi:hypothetical protein